MPKVLGGQTCLIRRIKTLAPSHLMQIKGSRSCADAATSVAPTVT